MLAVGLRELKAKLGQYVRRARDGEVVFVTERGKVIAELRAPISIGGIVGQPAGLIALAEAGELMLGLDHEPNLYSRPTFRKPPSTAADLLHADRNEG